MATGKDEAMKIETFPISTVGEATIQTPLDTRTPFTTDKIQVFYDREADGAIRAIAENGKIKAFEKAGPREKLFFDPNEKPLENLVADGGFLRIFRYTVYRFAQRFIRHVRIPFRNLRQSHGSVRATGYRKRCT